MGLTKVTYAMIDGASVNVLDYGATGDGTTDDAAAIQAAIDSLPSTGGEVFIPSGIYLFSSTINVNKPILLNGTGSGAINNSNVGSVLLKSAALNGTGINVTAAGSNLKNLTLQGVAGNGGDGIVIASYRIVIEDVSVFAMGRDGVRIGVDTGPSNCNGWVIRNLRSKNNGRHGLYINDKILPTLPDANGGTLTSADLQYNTEAGLVLGNNAVNTFVGLLVQNNGTYGVYSGASSQSNFFYGGDFEVNGRVGGASITSYYDFYIAAGSKRNCLIGLSSYNDPQTFFCDDPENTILGYRDNAGTGPDNQYLGLQLNNIDSEKTTVLDWYKEGTFEPSIVGTSSAGTGTYSVQKGFYTRIGNVVRFNISLTWSAHTGTGNMRIAGLPFTASNLGAGFQPVEIVPSEITTPADAVVKGMIIDNDTKINLYTVLTSGTTTLAALAIDTVGTFWISGTYQVA